MVVHYKSKNGYAFRVMSMRTLVNLIEERKNLFKVTYRPGLGNNQNEYIGDKPNIQQGYARSHKMVRQFAKISIAAKINNRAFL